MNKTIRKSDGFLNKKRILITGGTGSWGQQLVKTILSKYNPEQIIIYSRGEIKQVEMKRKFSNPKLHFVIGDVRDTERLEEASENIDIIFHLAALKHVPVCEENPWEAISINVVGTKNVINSAIKNKVSRVVYVSTDKAVNPINLYGITKAASERLIVNANLKKSKTVFACIRAGNVMGSTGSVIPLFKKQIETSNMITITDERMTRFIMSLGGAINLLLKTAEKAVGGEVFVTKMPGIKIIDLAHTMIKELGDKNTEIKKIGIRPGEKIHEMLISQNEVSRTVEYGSYYIILPYVPIEKPYVKFQDAKAVTFDYYSSATTNILNSKEIVEILRKNNFLRPKLKYDELIADLDKTTIKRLAKDEKWLI